MGRLDGKICVITGAGGGMGADAAVRFAEQGALIVVADVDVAAAKAVAGEVDGLAVEVDVSEEASVRAMYAAAAERFGGIDVRDDDLRSLLGEELRRVGTHPAAGSCDDADLVLQPVHAVE